MPTTPSRVLASLLVAVSFDAVALNSNTGVVSSALTQAKTGGAGSSGTFGVGSVAVAPDLFTGTLTHAIPLAVVPGRHGMQPDVQLRYRSTNGNGTLGVGWELSLGDVERKTKG